jgi:hypothetical protein
VLRAQRRSIRIEEGGMAQLEVVNPVAVPVRHSVAAAARQGDLRGATIGLYWNMKAGGSDALDRIEELLRERFPGAAFKRYHGSVGFLMRHCTAEDSDRIAREVHAVVGTTAD